MKIRHQKTKIQNSSGFTLIEIVIVLTIIVILSAGVIKLLKGNVEFTKELTTEQGIEKIATQIQLYEARNMRPPTTEQGIKALVEKPTIEPVPERWMPFLEEVPKDAWGNEYKYRYPAQKSKKSYDLYSTGANGIEGDEDDIGNWKPGATKK
ncbi:MAG: type II secretion system major pseudopilin GspG [Verrucomicrobiaceae bacterium]|nr:type II secretion system major pseudopilin GspG [Verrucomicrobiaceae bacterium]